MKQYIFKTAILAVLVTLFACEDLDREPVAGLAGVPVINGPGSGSTYVLTEENSANVMATFSWTKADYGFSSATEYSVQLDVDGGDFSDPAVLGKTTDTLLAVTVLAMNSTLTSVLGLSPDVAHSLQVRVVGNLNEKLDQAISAVITLTITPYYTEVVYPMINVPGSFQDWDPAGPPHLASPGFNTDYEGYVWFPDPNTEFKFTVFADWSENYGDDGADGTLDRDGANIIAADAGYYRLDVDLSGYTYVVLKTDWGLVGTAQPGGWDADTDMTYDDVNGVWTITMDLIEGVFKFRANDDWALNYGSNGANGFCDKDGSDIPISAGNYTIILDLSNPPVYTYTVTQN